MIFKHKLFDRGKNFILNLLYQHTVLSLIIFFSITATGILLYVSTLEKNIVKSSALDSAALFSQTVKEFRTIYTSEVIDNVDKNHTSVSHDYKSKDKAIPLPATLSMMLGERIGQYQSGAKAKLYSPYPFPWRAQSGGLNDQFAKDAWIYLNKNPDKVYYQFTNQDGQQLLRYATADKMRTACVACHNSHPDTPKTGWTTGDVRGIVEVVYPVIDNSQFFGGLTQLALILLMTATIGIMLIGYVIRKQKNTAIELEKQVAQRTQSLSEANDELKTQIAEKTRYQKEIESLNKEMLEVSRNAGKAEIASSILHNLGNVLNSVNISVESLESSIENSKANKLNEASIVLDEELSKSNEISEQKKKERLLLSYISKVSKHIMNKNIENIGEVKLLKKHFNHIANIISTQQKYANKVNVTELTCANEVIDDAVEMASPSLNKNKIIIKKDYAQLPKTFLDSHKISQVLVNLINNAKDAIIATDNNDAKQIHIKTVNLHNNRFQIIVTDTGIGITPQQKENMFKFGFTTKKEGHGFGLHGSANIIKELHGDIWVKSDGKHSGSSFFIELPFQNN